MQGICADPKTTETPDLELHQLDDANEASEMQHSGHPPNVLQRQHCDYKTAYYSALKSDSREHSVDMIQCQHCHYKTTRSDNLKEHSRKHTGDMLQCEYCEYKTAHPKNMKVHARNHTGDMFTSMFTRSSKVNCLNRNELYRHY